MISEALYDLENDPEERNNVIGNPVFQRILDHLRSSLRDHQQYAHPFLVEEADPLADTVASMTGFWQPWNPDEPSLEARQQETCNSHIAHVRDLPEPELVSCIDQAIDLEVVRHCVMVDDLLEFRTRAYRVNGQVHVPAPTIVMQAGSECNITIHNKLPSTLDDTLRLENNFHGASVTNLHTHGLHVHPEEDNINTHVKPGERYTYSYHLPEDHLPGTHWYHAHHHGSTALQVGGGLAGMLLVVGSDAYYRELASDLAFYYGDPRSERPREATGQEPRRKVHHLILNHFAFGDDYWDPEVDFQDLWASFSYPNLSDLYDLLGNDDTIKPRPRLFTNVSDFYTVNGQYQPTQIMVSSDCGQLASTLLSPPSVWGSSNWFCLTGIVGANLLAHSSFVSYDPVSD